MQKLNSIGALARGCLLSMVLCLPAITASAATSSTSTLEGADSSSVTVELTKLNRQRLEEQRTAFIAAPNLSERLEQLQNFEQQALQLAVDEPLKLGSIGSAILDLYPGSLTGHFAMSRFYGHVESPAAKQEHDNELALLEAYLDSTGDGSRESAYQAMTIYDAHTFVKGRNESPVGSIYQSSPQALEFGYVLVSRPAAAPLKQTFFDLKHQYLNFVAHATKVAGADAEHNPQASELNVNPWTFIRVLASRMDTAAQAAIGGYLTQVENYEDAISWLQVAARRENVLANALLARIYWTQADQEQDPEKKQPLKELTLENHLHAIALGSTDSMYTLASLYLSDYFGEENRSAGIALLNQAGEVNHVESLLYLGHLHYTGRDVPKDLNQANVYYARAAQQDNPGAIINYARFLVGLADNERPTDTDSTPIYELLEGLAKDDNAEAMVVLGNLYARGIGRKASNRLAIRWYKRAVKAKPTEADIVNEVAWTLTVSDVSGLKRGKYAKRIMDRLMTEDEASSTRPEYLDTWAAAHAAIGNFERAISLQEEAINEATKQQREDVLGILNEHLEQFKAGATITERAP